MKKYFVNCKTINELKNEYGKLCKTYHPDNNISGDIEIMKAINIQYDQCFEILKNIHNAKEENENNQNTEQPEQFRHIINIIVKLDGLVLEICGNWLWLSGNTYPHREIIKELGFKWSQSKKMWYLGESTSKKKGSMSMNKIRNRYGSTVYNSEQVLQLA